MYEQILNNVNDENHRVSNSDKPNTNGMRKSNVQNELGLPYVDDEPHNPNDVTDLKNIPEIKRSLFENEENYEYESLPSYTIDLKDLVTYDKLGSGCFGSVYRGTYKLRFGRNVQEIPVAIKQLNIDTEESKKEITKEAELMKSLNNPHIVKFIGMCFDGSSLRIVLELAKLGPLHKYLRTHKDEMSMTKIVKICYQVAVAMEYLSSKGLVHRDLAARNVLLVSEDLSKVSDFGMSRKMDENKYYETHSQGKWPLKWYPPDATSQGRFDEKSDVWSFGVTCWEATSFGGRPYQGIDIAMLLLKLENGHRLEKPLHCPDEIYNIMYKCWFANKRDRPTFSDLVREFKTAYYEIYQVKL
jgi:serine/threonine protein kinase